jgi:hypothetical protein
MIARRVAYAGTANHLRDESAASPAPRNADVAACLATADDVLPLPLGERVGVRAIGVLNRRALTLALSRKRERGKDGLLPLPCVGVGMRFA